MAIDYTKRGGPAQPEPAQSPAGAPVSLSKVTLTKSAPAVSLSKQGGASGVLRVNLNWNARPAAPAGGGLFKRLAAAGSPGIDLDLGCLYEFADGSKGVVQALGNAFASRSTFSAEPVVWLDGDDRSGAASGGENLFVNLAYSTQIRRVLVFASIYAGAPNWAAAEGVVTLFPVAGPEIEVRLDEHDPSSPLCAIAMLEFNGSELQVRREVRYIQGAQDVLDRTYGWGMDWKAGRK
jgi:tellurite resistance protein TerA